MTFMKYDKSYYIVTSEQLYLKSGYIELEKIEFMAYQTGKRKNFRLSGKMNFKEQKCKMDFV